MYSYITDDKKATKLLLSSAKHKEYIMSNEMEFLIYKTPEEDIRINAVLKDETIWLTQKGMSELFGCTSDNISLHLKNIFNEGELNKDSVTEKISATASDGKNYLTQFYNLDEKQIRRLERTVTGYFDYVEDLIEDEFDFDKEIKKSC